MKICFISNLYKPYNRGGAERVVEQEINELKEDHEVTLITAGPWRGLKSLWPKAEIEDGVLVYRFYPLNLFFYPHDVKKTAGLRLLWHIIDVFNLHSALTISKILWQERPNAIHAHNLKGLGYLAPWVIRRAKANYVQTLHDVQLATPTGLIIHKHERNWQQKIFLVKWYQAINRWLFASPNVVISPSKYLLEFYEQRGFFPKSKKIVLRNPATTVKSRPQKQNRLLDLLFLGQLEDHKGILFLLEAFMNWPEPKARLHIVGQGRLEKAVKKLARKDERIIVHGFIFSEQLPEVMSQMDTLVVPTLCYENSPSVIYEAMAVCLPPIVADIGGTAELIKHEKNGWVFPAGDVDSLLAIFSSLNQHKLSEVGASAQKSMARFNLANHIKQLLELYEKTG